MGKLKDHVVTITPKLDPREIPKFSREMSKGLKKSGGSFFSGMMKAGSKASKFAKGANESLKFIKTILDQVTKASSLIKKLYPVGDNIAKVAKSIGTTSGRLANLAYAFAGGEYKHAPGEVAQGATGSGADTVFDALQQFADRGMKEGGFLKEGDDVIDSFLGALKEIQQEKDFVKQGKLVEKYFGSIARRGEGVMDLVSNLDLMEKVLKASYHTQSAGVGYGGAFQEELTRMFAGGKGIEGFASQAGNLAFQGQIEQMLTAFRNNTLGAGVWAQRTSNIVDKGVINVATLEGILNSLNIRAIIEASADKVFQIFMDKVSKNFNLKDPESIINFIEKAFNFILAPIGMIKEAVLGINRTVKAIGSYFGFNSPWKRGKEESMENYTTRMQEQIDLEFRGITGMDIQDAFKDGVRTKAFQERLWGMTHQGLKDLQKLRDQIKNAKNFTATKAERIAFLNRLPTDMWKDAGWNKGMIKITPTDARKKWQQDIESGNIGDNQNPITSQIP